MVVKIYKCFRAVLTSVLLYSCFIPSSLAGHIHCKIDPWTLTLAESNPGHSGVGLIPVPAGWTAESTDACMYELSDITSLEVTFTFNNTATLTTSGYVVTPGAQPPLIGTENAQLIDNPTAGVVFMSEVPTTMLFAPHTSDNGEFGGPPATHIGIASEFDFEAINRFDAAPSRSLIADDFADWTMTEAVYTLHGNHYYLPVAEPSTLSLMFSSLLLFPLLGVSSRNGI